IRQDSRKHDDLWEGIIAKKEGEEALKSFKSLGEEEKIAKILTYKDLPAADSMKDPFHAEILKSLDAINYIQKVNGVMGCHRYIISNAQSAIHILEVFQLNKLQLSKGKNLNVDIVPLFETIDDLLHAPGIM